MLLSYGLEPRSKWMVLVFAGGSGATALYSGLAAVYPIAVIETLWALVALRRFWRRHRQEGRLEKPTADGPVPLSASGCE